MMFNKLIKLINKNSVKKSNLPVNLLKQKSVFSIKETVENESEIEINY